MTHSLAAELAPHNITVNSEDETWARFKSRIPSGPEGWRIGLPPPNAGPSRGYRDGSLGRFQTPKDIGEMAAFLALRSGGKHHRRRLQCRRRRGNALSGWHRKRYAGALAHEALLPPIWSCRPSGWSVQSASARVVLRLPPRATQAGEPGLIARQARGSLSHSGAVAVSCGFQEAVVALQEAGDFFGEGCLAGEALRLSTVTALTKCVIARISKKDITRVIHEEPAFAELFIANLLARNSRVEEDLVDQLFNSSEKRLARTLLLLANFGKEGRPEPIIAKVSQETLAEMIGTTRSRVSFFMNKFRKLGLIDYNGSIEIHSSLLNVVLRDQPQIKR